MITWDTMRMTTLMIGIHGRTRMESPCCRCNYKESYEKLAKAVKNLLYLLRNSNNHEISKARAINEIEDLLHEQF